MHFLSAASIHLQRHVLKQIITTCIFFISKALYFMKANTKHRRHSVFHKGILWSDVYYHIVGQGLSGLNKKRHNLRIRGNTPVKLLVRLVRTQLFCPTVKIMKDLPSRGNEGYYSHICEGQSNFFIPAWSSVLLNPQLVNSDILLGSTPSTQDKGCLPQRRSLM